MLGSECYDINRASENRTYELWVDDTNALITELFDESKEEFYLPEFNLTTVLIYSWNKPFKLSNNKKKFLLLYQIFSSHIFFLVFFSGELCPELNQWTLDLQSDAYPQVPSTILIRLNKIWLIARLIVIIYSWT